MRDTLIDLRTAGTDRLVGRLEPGTLRLHVRLRGEECVFDLPAIVRSSGQCDGLIWVRSGSEDEVVEMSEQSC